MRKNWCARSGFPAHEDGASGNNGLVIRNVTIKGRRTSIRLERRIWDALAEICRREFCTPDDFCSAVAERKTQGSSLTSSIRVEILDYFVKSATEDGHRRAGHGQGMFMAQRREREEIRSIYRSNRKESAYSG